MSETTTNGKENGEKRPSEPGANINDNNTITLAFMNNSKPHPHQFVNEANLNLIKNKIKPTFLTRYTQYKHATQNNNDTMTHTTESSTKEKPAKESGTIEHSDRITIQDDNKERMVDTLSNLNTTTNPEETQHTTTYDDQEHTTTTKEKNNNIQRTYNDYEARFNKRKMEEKRNVKYREPTTRKRKVRGGRSRKSGKANGHCSHDYNSEDDPFENSTSTTTTKQNDGGNGPRQCSKTNGHCTPDYADDDDAFDTSTDTHTSMKDRRGNGGRKRSKANGHCTPDHTNGDASDANNQQQQKESDSHTSTNIEASWLDEDKEDNPWLFLLPTKEQSNANDIRKKARRKLNKKIRRQELRERRKQKTTEDHDRRQTTTEGSEMPSTPTNTHTSNANTYTPLTVFNTRLATSKMPTHSPRLPYPYENWPDDTFTGQYDTSMCILAEPSVLGPTDFTMAREHLRNQLETDPHSHPPIQPVQRSAYTLRSIPRPVYDVDALLRLSDFATTQALWTLRKHNNYSVGIGLSCLPGAQRGLFTTKEREDSEFICPYLGPLISCDTSNLPAGEYNFFDPVRSIVILGNPATSYGPYANDPLDEQHANCRIAWRKNRGQYWLKAEGPIASRTELLLMYGHEFWEHNQLLPHEIILRAYPQHLRRPARNKKAQC